MHKSGELRRCAATALILLTKLVHLFRIYLFCVDESISYNVIPVSLDIGLKFSAVPSILQFIFIL